MIDSKILKKEEKAIFALRSLYKKYGYKPFKMSKFEEYEFYIRNKDFLISDRIITFNDTNGKLLALKPDVTLSIIKNCEEQKGEKQKVFYNENVYRISENTHRYKEIMQAGLECIGDIDLYDIYETVSLSAESLSLISEDFILEISHLGILSQVLDFVCDNKTFKAKAMNLIANKNAHDLKRLCNEFSIDTQKTALICNFISVYGERNKVIAQLENLCADIVADTLNELKTLYSMLDNLPFSSKIVFDFSVVNDMNYYNGIVFKGFINGICDGILAGGQYDNLMKKMNRKSGAVGFALYLDLLEQLPKEKNDYDVEVLLIYDENCSNFEIAKTVDSLIKSGKTVTAQKCIPQKLRYKEIIDLRKEGYNA